MVKERLWVWCKFSHRKESNRIYSQTDLEYPDKLHVLHNDFPLAAEKLSVPYDMLSDYCKKIADKYRIRIGDVKKVIPNLSNKTNYVVNYRNLRLCFSSWMKLTKIHRVLKFNQYH